jgi:Leucine-rich repeat (LRR) protein
VPPDIGQLAKLAQLHLNSNRLTSLPERLRRLSNHTALFLHGNPKLNLPNSALGPTFDDWDGEDETAPKPGPILDFYFRTRQAGERRSLYEGS